MYKIHYSNCWEDADVVIEALNIKPAGVYLSISSAGDNTLSILSQNPKFVLAVDKNPAQIACLEIRKAAIARLSYNDTMSFLGVTRSNRRVAAYQQLRMSLSPSSQCFWDRHVPEIKKGIIHAGNTEKNFNRFRKYVLPWIMTRSLQQQLLQESSLTARKQLCDKVLNTWNYQLVMRSVFNKAMIKHFSIGKYSTFYQIKNGNLADIIIERIKDGLTSPLAHNNPYITYIMTGNYNGILPHYLREKVFSQIKRNIGRLHIFQGTMQQALESHPLKVFDGFNLSDIFEYMDHNEFRTCVHKIVGKANKGARLIYWNTLKKRAASRNFDGHLHSCTALVQNLQRINKSFFYNCLHVDEVTH